MWPTEHGTITYCLIFQLSTLESFWNFQNILEYWDCWKKLTFQDDWLLFSVITNCLPLQHSFIHYLVWLEHFEFRPLKLLIIIQFLTKWRDCAPKVKIIFMKSQVIVLDYILVCIYHLDYFSSRRTNRTIV